MSTFGSVRTQNTYADISIKTLANVALQQTWSTNRKSRAYFWQLTDDYRDPHGLAIPVISFI